MEMNENETKNSLILGQKYAYATVSLILGISCFVSLLGLEKAILAVAFGWLALRAKPAPQLKDHRVWAKTGVMLGVGALLFVPILLILYFDRVREIIELFSKMDGSK